MDKPNVHAAHCCAVHGCKYFEPDCPVVRGKVKSKYSCEDCGHDQRRLDKVMQEGVDLGLFQDTEEMRMFIRKIL